jgi:hypothetical protein
VLHDGRTAANVSALAGATLAGGHALRAAEARPANTYICNETNWRALKAVRMRRDARALGDVASSTPARAARPSRQPPLPRVTDARCPLPAPAVQVRRAADPAAPAEEHVRLQAAYFVHLPYAAEGDEGHEKLAASVAELIGQMLRRLD